jgi:DNA-binding SARP family transcriptional activator
MKSRTVRTVVTVRDVHGDGEGHPQVALRLLGAFELCRDGKPVELPANVQRLLAFVGLNNGVSRALTAGTLWPDVTEDLALGSLRSAIWRLHRVCPRVLQPSRHSLTLAETVSVDVSATLADTIYLPDVPDATVIAAATRVAALGELLSGWYDDWVLLERERLRQVRLHALEDFAVSLIERGKFGAALNVALAAIKSEPLRESAHRLVIRVHLAEGNPGEAMRQFQAYQSLLADELGLQPSEQILRLIRPLHIRPPARREPLLTERQS